MTKAALTCLLVTCALPALALTAPDFQWAETYEGGGLYVDEVVATLSDEHGDLIIAGTSHDGVDGMDMLICKLSREDGHLVWETRVPAFDTNDMAVSGMVFDGYGKLLVSGYVVGCVG